jgi:3-oxoacyl-[acyl-carrier-protein] synthase-3
MKVAVVRRRHCVLLARKFHQGLICYQLGSDGGGSSLLDRPSGGTKRPLTAADVDSGSHYLRMDGKSVFKWAVRALTESIDLVLRQSGLSVDDVGLYVLHQANIRIINNAVEQLGIPADRVYNNLQNYGNTSGGSIPIALDEALQQGRLARGDTLLMSGFGAGLTWGTSLFRWCGLGRRPGLSSIWRGRKPPVNVEPRGDAPARDRSTAEISSRRYTGPSGSDAGMRRTL